MSDMLEKKKKELADEIEFYHDLRNNPRKSPSEFQAQKRAERTIDKLQKEIAKLEAKV